jgi:hypothetical protein
VSDAYETQLKLALMSIQIEKAQFDMHMESKKFRLQTAALLVSIIAVVVAAFAAGHFIR